MRIERYGIYWVNLDPVVGAEIAKTRPMVVVSDDLRNARLDTVVGCPLTSTLHPRWRSRVQVDCAGRASEIAVDQIRTVSRLRFVAKLDQLPDDKAAELRQVIREMYGEP